MLLAQIGPDRTAEAKLDLIARHGGLKRAALVDPGLGLLVHLLGVRQEHDEFQCGPSSDTKKLVDPSGKVTDLKAGAFESYEKGGGNKGVKSDISCACHWTVNQAASEKIGKMWGKSYVFTPGGIMVSPESKITELEQLAGQEIAVGYHSGSHYTTIQAHFRGQSAGRGLRGGRCGLAIAREHRLCCLSF